MDLTYGPEYDLFREEVRAFLAEHWRPPGDTSQQAGDSSRQAEGDGDTVAAFRRAAVAAGYLYRSVPCQYGGAGQPSDVLKARVIREEFTAARAPMELKSLGTQLLVPTLLEAGAEWQKERFIEATITGQITWCQGYSEPGAGSDLASLRTTATLTGDRWVIRGQKVWTSFAHQADYMFLLARTHQPEPESDADKRTGISYLLVPMDQPGIEVRPLRQITGESEFNEVFLTDATTGAEWVVGEPGRGWAVANTTLQHERAWVGDVTESDHLMNRLIRLARQTPGPAGRPWIEDPRLRSRLMEVQGYVEAHRYSGYLQLSRSLKGESSGALGLTNKISSTNIAERIAAIAIDILGDASLLPHTGAGLGADVGPERWMYQYFGSLGSAIAGGASNIQRNIIAQRGLGLPRDPRVPQNAPQK